MRLFDPMEVLLLLISKYQDMNIDIDLAPVSVKDQIPTMIGIEV